MKLVIQHWGGVEDGRVEEFELRVGDALAWHDQPAPVREDEAPLAEFRLVSERELRVRVRMKP